jgi:predicted RNase H-like HicB family nuclease
MTNQPTSGNYSGKFPDFAGLMTQNSKLSTTLQALGKEWTQFVGARLHEDSQLLQALGECRELPSVQRAYAQFWEKALSQYGEETQRLMRITQGAVEDAAHIAQERIEATNGNAQGSGASGSSMPPSPPKRASHSR